MLEPPRLQTLPHVVASGSLSSGVDEDSENELRLKSSLEKNNTSKWNDNTERWLRLQADEFSAVPTENHRNDSRSWKERKQTQRQYLTGGKCLRA